MSEYSKYSGGVGPSPPRQIPGAPNHPNPTSYSQPHHDGTFDALAGPTFLNRDGSHVVRKPLSPPLQEDRDPAPDMETDGYYTPLDSGDDASRDSNSHEGNIKSSFAPPRQGLAKLQAQRDGLVGNGGSGPVDSVTTSVSEDGAHSTPPLPSCVEC
jgi:hypothetical protein